MQTKQAGDCEQPTRVTTTARWARHSNTHPVTADQGTLAGGAVEDAIGVAARELGDVQLGLWIARLLQPSLQHNILQRALEGVENSAFSACRGPYLHYRCPGNAVQSLGSMLMACGSWEERPFTCSVFTTPLFIG